MDFKTQSHFDGVANLNYFRRVKQLAYGGTGTLIRGSRPWPAYEAKFRDAWGTHAAGTPVWDIQFGRATSLWYAALAVKLISGDVYWYPFFYNADTLITHDVVLRIENTNFPRLPEPAEGEWWNYFYRSQVLDKVLVANLPAWLDVH